jgi:flagellar P-ring protein precursor FlgI
VGENVKISKVALSHGNISVKVGGSGDSKNQSESRVHLLDSGANVGELVQALNKLGVTPKDLISILQSVKAAGALHGELDLL